MHRLEHNNSKERERRKERYRLLRAAQRVTDRPKARVRSCKRRLAEGVTTVDVKRSGEGHHHLSGLRSCGSVWACPVCAAKIRSGRASEVEEVVDRHFKRDGEATFVTLTVPHGLGDDLERLWDAVADSWRKVTGARRWRALGDTYGPMWRVTSKGRVVSRVGVIRSLEITHGVNGWHPHLHVLLLHYGDGAELVEYLQSAWPDAVERHGLSRPSEARGVVASAVAVKDVGEAVRYLVKEQDGRKIGSEMARHDLKVGRRKGRTPFQLLDSAGDGEVRELALWRQYERVSRGRQAITFSQGLRKWYGLEVEKTEEELAEEAVGGDLVYACNELETRWITQDPSRIPGLLEAAEREGSEGCWEYLRNGMFGWAPFARAG